MGASSGYYKYLSPLKVMCLRKSNRKLILTHVIMNHKKPGNVGSLLSICMIAIIMNTNINYRIPI